MVDELNPPVEEMVGGVTYGPKSFKMKISLRWILQNVTIKFL